MKREQGKRLTSNAEVQQETKVPPFCPGKKQHTAGQKEGERERERERELATAMRRKINCDMWLGFKFPFICILNHTTHKEGAQHYAHACKITRVHNTLVHFFFFLRSGTGLGYSLNQFIFLNFCSCIEKSHPITLKWVLGGMRVGWGGWRVSKNVQFFS